MGLGMLKNKNKETEVVLTGRFDLSKKMFVAADYVSEIKSLKHPYVRGIRARNSIEF